MECILRIFSQGLFTLASFVYLLLCISLLLVIALLNETDAKNFKCN